MTNPYDAASRPARIRERLRAHLGDAQIELVDESHLHIGHAGAREGKGHFRVRIVSARFAGLKPLQRHRLVFDALGDMMQTDIHALNITALTPEEAAARP
ncbi:MAG: BolA family protein [Gammaproteobacteria bacterium]|nr:BolA family transcriptional regulator [Gammaproteobacteria bacterium]